MWGFRQRSDDLEARLRDERPQPSDELVRRLSSDAGLRDDRRSPRLGLVIALSVAVVLAFALTGGIGYAASAAASGTSALKGLVVRNDDNGKANAKSGSASDQYGRKVLICHIPPGNPGNAHTISVPQSAVPAHLAHGDSLGACPGGKKK